ncbi:MAG: hypothetical protein M3014_15095 [Chloroflexota bacterium]|nr:hypothetical protein [Chloroflexota bacterium]
MECAIAKIVYLVITALIDKHASLAPTGTHRLHWGTWDVCQPETWDIISRARARHVPLRLRYGSLHACRQT